MRLEKIHIYGFGALRDVQWTLGEGVNLVEGNNEAGKTTLLAFIRAVLFGFEKRNPNNPETRYEPLAGGTFGGALEICDDDGKRLRIERVYHKRVAGDVTVYLPDGRQADETYLRRILGGISEKVFKNVFAFGLGELQQFESLRHEEINQFIYTAGTGDGPAIARAQKVLAEKEEKLFLPKGNKPEINALLKDAENVHKEWNRLKKETLAYDEWAAELQQLDKRIAEREKEIEQLRGFVSWQEKLYRQYEAYEQYVSLENQLRALPEVDVFPENGSVRLEELQKNIGYLEAELADYREKLRLARERKALLEQEIVLALLEQRRETEELRDHLNGYREHNEQLQRCHSELAGVEDKIREILDRLGAGWTEEKVNQFDCSHGVKHIVASFRQELADLREEEKTAEQQLQTDRLSRERKFQALQEWKNREPNLFFVGGNLAPAEKEKEARILLARHREMLEEAKNVRLRQMEIEREIATAREKIGVYQEYSASFSGSYANHREHGKNGRAVAWLLLTAAIVVPAVLLLYDQPYVFAAIAFFLLVTGAFWQFRTAGLWQDRSAQHLAGPLAEWKKREAEAEELLRGLERERSNLAEEARRLLARMHRDAVIAETADTAEIAETAETAETTEIPPAVLPDSLLARWEKQYEDKLEQWQMWQRWSQQLAEKENELRLADELCARSEEEWQKKRETHAAHRERWRQWLQERGIEAPGLSSADFVLPVAPAALPLSPETVQDMIRDVESGKEAIRRKEDLLKERERLAAFIKDYEEKQRAVLAAIGATSPHTSLSLANRDPVYITGELNRMLEENREREALLRNMAEKTEEQEEQVRVLERRLQVEREQLQNLLRAAGTDDPEEFRRLEAVYKKREQLVTERKQICQSFCAMLADEEKLESFLQELSQQSKQEIAEKLAECRDKLARAGEEVNNLRERRGRLQANMERLASGEELSLHAHLYQQKVSDLRKKAGEWAAVVMCRHIMQRALRVYETEKQPAVLQKASFYLREITNGRYVRVLAPLGETKIEVERHDGRRLEPGYLSRGTVEQLYLAMRFALVDEYGGQTMLPIVLDDIFVNFDPARARAAVRTLKLLAEQRQIIYFTCHPHVRELFAGEQAAYRHIKLPERGTADKEITL